MTRLTSMIAAILGLLVCIAAPMVNAQSNGSAQLAQHTVRLEFHAISLGENDTELYYKEGNSFHRIELRPFDSSPAYRYQGPATVQFYRKTSAGSDSANTHGLPNSGYTEAGSVQFTSDIRNAQLLFVPLPNGDYQILTQNNDKDALPEGTARIYNASPMPIAVKAGEEQMVVLRPGEQIVATGNGVNLLLQAAIPDNNSWALARSSVFTLKPRHRLNIFFTMSDSNFFRSQTFDGSLTDSDMLQVFSIRN